jgi:sterol desaturase/sphingolipid hydroxylase (fatty acid hydroxylase superfamily)
MTPDAPMIAAYTVLRTLNPAEGYYWGYLAGGLMFAAGVAIWRRRGRRRIKPRALLGLLGTRKLWLHPSTGLDVKLYVMHSVLTLVAYGLFQATSQVWAAGAGGAMSGLFGHGHLVQAPRWIVGTGTTVLQILALEFGYWAAHYAFHRSAVLWEIHKIHHSAEVMTPLTEWRQHPIEFVAFANVLSLATGLVYGIMTWAFGPAAQPFTLFQMNIVLVIHLATFHHLRHSGVWIAATGWLGRIVHSPAHHQIHHSTDPAHFDRNMGYALSVWDWAFGTLHIPERCGRVKLGVPNEPAYTGLVDTLVRPLREGGRRLAPARPAAPAGEAG